MSATKKNFKNRQTCFQATRWQYVQIITIFYFVKLDNGDHISMTQFDFDFIIYVVRYGYGVRLNQCKNS